MFDPGGLIGVGVASAAVRTGSAREMQATTPTTPCVSMTGSPSYQHVVLIMDENVGYTQIPTFVVSPYVSPGSVDKTDHNLYGLLGDVEDILGYPRLGRAVGQGTLRKGLGGF